MIRGTTPTLEFSLPFDTDLLAEAYMTLSQQGVVKVDKHLTECECRENKLSVTLSQEDTLKLDCACTVDIQIRARTLNGEALASDIITECVGRILKEGVI